MTRGALIPLILHCLHSLGRRLPDARWADGYDVSRRTLQKSRYGARPVASL